MLIARGFTSGTDSSKFSRRPLWGLHCMLSRSPHFLSRCLCNPFSCIVCQELHPFLCCFHTPGCGATGITCDVGDCRQQSCQYCAMLVWATGDLNAWPYSCKAGAYQSTWYLLPGLRGKVFISMSHLVVWTVREHFENKEFEIIEIIYVVELNFSWKGKVI